MKKPRPRIALLAGQSDETYQRSFITGFLNRAFAADMDVCIFSMYHKYQDNTTREKGEANIFTLVEPEFFEGIVILEDTIQTAGVGQQLEERFHETFKKPVLVIEKDSPFFPSVSTDGYTPVTELVEHLITVHGFTDIAFLTGKRWHKHSQQRLQAYKDTMTKHGLPVRQNRMIYGDFWYQSGEMCAEQLLSDDQGLPQAVVCANDPMAIGLCKAFDKHGVKIPDDIAVLSYDSTFEGQTSPKSITSSMIPAEEVGSYAAEYILNKLKGIDIPPFSVPSKLLIGESCGCCNTTMPEYSLKRTGWGTEISEESFGSVSNFMVENLMAQTNLLDYLGMIYSYAYQINGMKSFMLCLSAPWKNMENDPKLRLTNDGYPNKMICAVRYNCDHKDGHVGLTESFSRSELLPNLSEVRDEPQAFFITPVCCEEMCFGYAALTYGKAARSYDENYRRWIGFVSRGFEVLRRYVVMQNVSEQLEKIRASKFSDLRTVYESLSDGEKHDYKLVESVLENNLFSYMFQPIVDTVNGEIYAYEALMRSYTEKNLPPLLIIKYADMMGRLADVENATFRNVLKVVVEKKDELGKAKMFINSLPRVSLSDRDLSGAEAAFGDLSGRVVVELTEEAEFSDRDLEQLKSFFKKLNIETAVDDYGTGYSNVNNLLRYMPDYVKIDRALLSEIQNKPQKQHFVREVIDFCHNNGIKALAEGVETVEELKTVIYLGADLIQGFYTGTPEEHFIDSIDERIRDQIRRFHREKLQGVTKRSYIAGKTNRVTLAALTRKGFSEIVVGKGTMVYNDITVIGAPGIKSEINMKIENGYTGCITLEDVYFSNVKNHPCIELGENSDVTLIIVGDNTFSNTGIRVPESSKLTVDGEGELSIRLTSSEYYGIGTSADERHGRLIFDLSGNIEISGSGTSGVCIGSGAGGCIRINSGRFSLEAGGNSGVCIGALTGEADVRIRSSNISIDFSAADSVGIGSLSGSSNVRIAKCALSIFGNGNRNVGIGTLGGNCSETKILESSPTISLSAVSLSGIGALRGKTLLFAEGSALKIETSGDNALAVGGYNIDQEIVTKNCDVKWKVSNKTGIDTNASQASFRMVNSRGRFEVNGMEIGRPNQFE